MGASVSKTKSEQDAIVSISQIYKGTCDLSCQNIEEDITVDVISSVLGGGIVFRQSCSVDGNCMFNNTSDAAADVFFKATNSSNAKNAWSGWTGNPFEIDVAESKSKQSIKESITQKSSQDCKLSSYNQMNDISVFVVDSTLGGGIEFDQTGEEAGSCVLDNNMQASAYATGYATNTAQSGKDKKGDKSNVLKILIYGGIVIALLIVTFIVAKFITGHFKKQKQTQKSGNVPTCPPGTNLIVDPRTNDYACQQQRVSYRPPVRSPLQQEYDPISQVASPLPQYQQEYVQQPVSATRIAQSPYAGEY
jgi:hypothetical protein